MFQKTLRQSIRRPAPVPNPVSLSESFDALFGGDHPLFDFIAVENSKPGRQSNYIVVHATPEWSTQHLESDPAEISELIREAFSETFQVTTQARLSHRWRYARPINKTVFIKTI